MGHITTNHAVWLTIKEILRSSFLVATKLGAVANLIALLPSPGRPKLGEICPRDDVKKIL